MPTEYFSKAQHRVSSQWQGLITAMSVDSNQRELVQIENSVLTHAACEIQLLDYPRSLQSIYPNKKVWMTKMMMVHKEAIIFITMIDISFQTLI